MKTLTKEQIVEVLWRFVFNKASKHPKIRFCDADAIASELKLESLQAEILESLQKDKEWKDMTPAERLRSKGLIEDNPVFKSESKIRETAGEIYKKALIRNCVLSIAADESWMLRPEYDAAIEAMHEFAARPRIAYT